MDTEDEKITLSEEQLIADKHFIRIADLFIEQANEECKKVDHKLVNASLMYSTARFSAYISASMSPSKSSYEENMDAAIDFYLEEFKKMLQEHMQQYKVIFDQKPQYPY